MPTAVPAEFRTTDDLRACVEALYRRNCTTSAEILEDLAHMEGYVQQSYAGRSLFELLQNGRDAAQVAGQPGTLEVELLVRQETVWLLVRNTGAPLTPAGVEGLTRFGQSTKSGVGTIGHKGLGFKAVRQLSDRPRLVTRWGTLQFDVALTQARYEQERGQPAPAALPLFYLPHYAPDCLTPEELDRDVATRIELPLRDATAHALVEADLADLGPRQLVLLGMVRELLARTPAGSTRYEFTSRPNGRLDVHLNEQLTERYRQYTTLLALPAAVLAGASAEEQAILQRMGQVEVRLLLEVDARGRFVPQLKPRLYLYYPLLLETGFRFLIHSFFLVDPARTHLRRQCPPNTFLLTEIGRFIGSELVRRLTAADYDPVGMLYYQRVNELELKPLYDAVQAHLKVAACIRMARRGEPVRYLRPSEVLCAEPMLAGLLPAGQVGNRWLVPVHDPLVRAWLREELGAEELTTANLGPALVQESTRQIGNLDFFRQLYKFIAAHPTLDFRPYRLLLNQAGKLVASGPAPVFYAARPGTKFALPKPLYTHLHLLHPDLALSEPLLRSLETRLGLRLLQPETLATQLLALLDDGQPAALRAPVLRALKDLARDGALTSGWLGRVWLPVQQGGWVRPWRRPVYLPSPELQLLYPDGLFLESSRWPELAGDDDAWNAFWLLVGAWDKPGLYVAADEHLLPANDPRNQSIRNWQYWGTTLVLRYDRLLDEPAQPTQWFTSQLLEHWPAYRVWLMQPLGHPFKVGSVQGFRRETAPAEQVPAWCGAVQYLRTAAWVVLPGRPMPESVAQLVGLSPGTGGRLRRVEDFLPVWHLDPDRHHSFCALVGLAHLTSRHLEPRQGFAMLSRVLQLVHARYPATPAEATAEFRDFYNQLLGRLLDYWDNLANPVAQQEVLGPLRELLWLAQTDEAGQLALHWQPARELLYLDDKPAYDQLLRDLQALPAGATLLPATFFSQFTLRDTQGFGRLARQLGRQFSKVLERTLKPGEVTAAVPLRVSSLFAPAVLPRLVALLESYRQRRFTATDLTRLGAVPVRRSPQLLVAFRLRAGNEGAASVAFELDQPYFLARSASGDATLTLYVRQTSAGTGAETWRPVVEALAALLPQLFDLAMPYLRPLLPELLTTTNWPAFDQKHDLSADRLIELQAELLPATESAEARFWQSIRQASGVAVVKDAAPWAGLQLAQGSTLPAELAAAFAAASGGELPQQAPTRALLTRLLHETGLPVTTLNEHVPVPFHFQALLEAEWTRARDQGRTAFTGRLHAGLARQPAEQAYYRRYLRQYERLSRPATPMSDWQPDYAALLPSRCAAEFKPGLLAGQAQLPPRDAATQYSQALRALRQQVVATSADATQLEDFLVNEERDSLLYFKQQARLAKEFRAWQQQQRAAEAAADPTASAALPVNPADFAQPIGRLVAPPPRPASGAAGPGGAGAGTREAQLNRDRIGRRAEERVWVWLREQGYREVTWVSANAKRVADTHAAHNALGSDEYHYDLRYLDQNGETVYVEVKGTSGPALEGYLSRQELAFAERQPVGRYQLLFVTRALDDARCQLFPLANPFLYEGTDDCWHNPHFRAEADTLRIAFGRPADD
jgi:hypothetical protein